MVVTVSIRSADATVPSLSLESPRIVLGRSRGSDVWVPDASVSSRHASIRQREADYLLLDEGSTNGTFVDGRRLSPGAPVVLKQQSEVRIGRVWLDISIEQAVPSPQPAKLAREIALKLIAGALEADGRSSCPHLVVRSGNSEGSDLLLEELERPYVVGRGHDCDLELDESDASRHHLEVMRRGHDVLVRDTESKNGTSLNGKRLPPLQAVPLEPGHYLTIGSSTLLFVDPLNETLRQLESTADEIMSEEETASRSKTVPDPDQTPDPGSAARVSNDVVEDDLPSAPSSRGRAPRSRKASSSSGARSPAKRTVRTVPTGRSWSTTDWLVAALAIVMLAASVAAMLWLFNTQ